MKNACSLTAFMLLCLSCRMPAAVAQPACVGGNASVPPGANTVRQSAPFYLDLTRLDLRTAPPTRDPSNPVYPRAAELTDGTLPPAGVEGNFIIGPTHPPAPEISPRADGPHGLIHSFTITSEHSTAYNPGVVRDDPPGCRNGAIYAAHTAPGDPSNLILTASHAGPWTRMVDVYVPANYVPGSKAPFLVFGDGGAAGAYPGRDLFAALDTLIEQRRLPPMIAIGIGAGGQDAQGSERGREYDAVSGTYAEWVEHEVLPLVERTAGVTLTTDPDGRATMGISSSGAAAFTMAWFHPELYHRVLAYSPTMVNQQWPHDPQRPGGAWEYHDGWAGAQAGSPLIPNSPAKPIRFWFEVGDQDLFYPAANMADGMHDWVLGDESMARVLAAKGYHYQFVFARGAGHVDPAVVAQTLPAALEWLWKDYPNRSQ